ncbi:barstar family protein [Niabella terrae]
MKELEFDFSRIGSMTDFYQMAGRRWDLPEYFGNNLDALWDFVTGDAALPLRVRFVHLSLSQLETFGGLIGLFEDAATALEGALEFEYYLSKEY